MITLPESEIQEAAMLLPEGYAVASLSLLASGLGMKEYHHFLEVGCGRLDVARLLIPYFQAGHYHGYDPNPEEVRLGIETHFGADLVRIKEPRFEHSPSFSAALFDRTFDFVLLHPQMLPASPEPLESLLEQIRSCLHRGSVVVTSFAPDQHQTEHLIDVLSALGFSVEFLNLEMTARYRWVVLRKNTVWFGTHRARENAVSTASKAPEPSTGSPGIPGISTVDEETRRRLEEEIARYAECIEVHDLPEIYHFWSNGYILPKLQSCGFESVDDFFVQFIVDACKSSDRTQKIISLGAGNCDLEVKLAQEVTRQGLTNVHFNCLELNPIMVERGAEMARQHGLIDHFSFDVTNIADWNPTESYDICIANHSLHHFVELEDIFAKVQRILQPNNGCFLINDMIGRNGHMRWPEALVEVEKFWAELPERYKYNHQLKRFEPEFVNWDCSIEGNEGIRAEDILPLLIESFEFEVFIAFANVIDIFVDRCFGHNFNPDNQHDLDFITRVAELDEAKLDSGEVKPTHMIAALRTAKVENPRQYKHWTPEFCVRYPD